MPRKSLLILCLQLGFFTCYAQASFDGRVGATSTGEILIRLVIKQGIQISNLQDIEINVDTSVSSDVVVSQRNPGPHFPRQVEEQADLPSSQLVEDSAC